MKTAYVSGVVYPLAWLTMIQKIDSLAVLKVVATIYGYDGVIGIDTEALTFGELLNRVGLSKRSLQEGIKKAMEAGYILSDGADFSPVYFPNTTSSPHDHVLKHDHDSFKLNNTNTNTHEHEGYLASLETIHKTLRLEFAMERSIRVADDICFSGKYPLEFLEKQLRYTRWEIKRGKNSDPERPIKNPAGWLVCRLRDNERKPLGFNLLTALVEDEGWDQEDLFMAMYNGDIDHPAIKDTFAYSSWLYEMSEAEKEAENEI